METAEGLKEGIPPLDELLAECGRLHGHMCAGQLLGARMAVLGCRLIGARRAGAVRWSA